MAAYHRRLNDPDRRVQVEAAKAWSLGRRDHHALAQRALFGAVQRRALRARLCAHREITTSSTAAFSRSGQLLRDAGRPLPGIPGVIVQGQSDVARPRHRHSRAQGLGREPTDHRSRCGPCSERARHPTSSRQSDGRLRPWLVRVQRRSLKENTGPGFGSSRAGSCRPLSPAREPRRGARQRAWSGPSAWRRSSTRSRRRRRRGLIAAGYPVGARKVGHRVGTGWFPHRAGRRPGPA